MITLWNPTDETFEMQFEGRMYRLEPEGRAKVSEPRSLRFPESERSVRCAMLNRPSNPSP